jgi:hypothetical protein
MHASAAGDPIHPVLNAGHQRVDTCSITSCTVLFPFQ